jgi:hypothetical protein
MQIIKNMSNNDKVVNKPEDIENFRTEKGKNIFDFTGVKFKCAMDFRGYFSGKNQENKFEEGTSLLSLILREMFTFQKPSF